MLTCPFFGGFGKNNFTNLSSHVHFLGDFGEKMILKTYPELSIFGGFWRILPKIAYFWILLPHFALNVALNFPKHHQNPSPLAQGGGAQE